MKKLVIFVLLAASSVSLTACAVDGPKTAGAIAAAADRAEIETTRALNVAEITYIGIASSALIAIKTGKVTGNDAVAVRNFNRSATNALIAAKAAQSSVVRSAETAKLIAATVGLQLYAVVPAGEIH